MTTREILAMNYWRIAEPLAVDLFGGVASAHLFGKKSRDLKKLSLLSDLQFYLDIMQQRKELDTTQGKIGTDYSILFCLDKIKKQLRCLIDGKMLNDLFAVYMPIGTDNSQGIGFMAIEGSTNPFKISNQ